MQKFDADQQVSDPGEIAQNTKSDCWYADIKPTESAGERIARRAEGLPAPKRKRVKLCADKRAAQKMLAELIDANERKAAGLVDYQSQTNQALGPIVNEYKAHLSAKGNSPGYVELTISRIDSVFDGCQFLRLVDLDAHRAATWLFQKRQSVSVELPLVEGFAASYQEIGDAFGENARAIGFWRRQGAPIEPRAENDLSEIRRWRIEYLESKGMAAGTSNHYATALRSFGRWLVKNSKRTDTNPFETLGKIDARADVRKQRRVLDPEKFADLISTTTASGRTVRGLSGSDRAMIYVLAAYTGLRASEIGSLKTNSFDMKSATVTVDPAYTKNGKLATIPLRSDLASRIGGYLESRIPVSLKINQKPETIWPGTWSDVGAAMIKVDLESAGIEYTDENGKDFDFHALRHQFITSLGKAGVSLKSAQELARHSKPELTANTYTHLSIKDTAADVERMPAIPSGEPNQAKSTGTAGLSTRMSTQVLRNEGVSGHNRPKSGIEAGWQKTKKDPVKTEFTESFEGSPGRT